MLPGHQQTGRTGFLSDGRKLQTQKGRTSKRRVVFMGNRIHRPMRERGCLRLPEPQNWAVQGEVREPVMPTSSNSVSYRSSLCTGRYLSVPAPPVPCPWGASKLTRLLAGKSSFGQSEAGTPAATRHDTRRADQLEDWSSPFPLPRFSASSAGQRFSILVVCCKNF